MNQRSSLIRGLIVLLFSVVCFSGCASSVKKGVTQVQLVRTALTELLPSDFSGPVDMSHTNSYFSITLKGGNIHRNAQGNWTWDWIEYERQSHIPLFSGMTWSSTGRIRLGDPSKPPVANPSSPGMDNRS